MGAKLRPLLVQFSKLLADGVQPSLRILIMFSFYSLPFDLQLLDASLDSVQLLGHRINLNPKLRCRLINEIDCFVRQEPIGNVTVAELGRSDNCSVGYPNTVMDLVTLLEAAQNRDGVFNTRLIHQDRLEASFQRWILFDMLAVLVDGCRTDGAQITARQRRLEHVRSINCTLSGSGPNESVQLVDEENDLPIGFCHFLENRLEPFFKLTAEARPGNQGAHIESNDPFRFQVFGHVSLDDTVSDAFSDGGLAHARITNEHRIVLCPAREHLQHTANLILTADDGIQLPSARKLIEIPAEPLKCLILIFRVLIRHPLRSAYLFEGFVEPVLRYALVVKEF